MIVRKIHGSSYIIACLEIPSFSINFPHLNNSILMLLLAIILANSRLKETCFHSEIQFTQNALGQKNSTATGLH